MNILGSGSQHVSQRYAKVTMLLNPISAAARRLTRSTIEKGFQQYRTTNMLPDPHTSDEADQKLVDTINKADFLSRWLVYVQKPARMATAANVVCQKCLQVDISIH